MALIRQRKLTKQQIRRINKQQANSQYQDSQLLDGVVMAHYGKQLEVQVTSLPDTLPIKPQVKEDEPEPFWQPIRLGDIWRCHSRTNLPMLATGDRVRWIADPNTGLGRIEVLVERRSLITRPDRYKKVKPVVANVDILAIVFAPLPLPAASLIDRYLLICHHSDVQPLLVLNKQDLLIENSEQGINKGINNSQALQLLTDYQNLGYDTLLTCCEEDPEQKNYQSSDHELIKTPWHRHNRHHNRHKGLSELQCHIEGKQVVFAGQSGVGKSSLINAMLPDSEQSVNVISENSKLGQHTTTTSRFLPFVTDDMLLTKGGIIDTPGIREYGIWHLEPEDIIAGFVELAPLADQCQFRDCQHTANSKGCALRQAVSDGQVLQRRVDSLVALQAEADTREW